MANPNPKVNSEKILFDLRDRVRAAVDAEREAYQQPSDADHLTDVELWKAVNSGQDGDAWLFCQLFRDRMVFDHAAGRWFLWHRHYWQEDLVGEATRSVDQVVDLYAAQAAKWAAAKLEAIKERDQDAAKAAAAYETAYLKRIPALQTLHHKRDVLVLASMGRDSLGISGEQWDLQPWLLPCENGVVDLKTGKLRPGRPDDFLKTVAPHRFTGLETKAPIWESFLLEIFAGDHELVDYVQRLLGYACTGLCQEHTFHIFWGRGRNGKGVKLETLAHVLGPLAGPIKAEMLLDQIRMRSSAAPDSDVMALRGRRLAWASESGEGRKLDLGKLKWLCGGDTLLGRAPFGKREISFPPSHALFLLTNHRPQVDASDYAAWQRIHLIAFTLSFVDQPDPAKPTERKRDPGLLAKLKAESAGILSWLVRGCLAWQEKGLDPPKAVREASKDYRVDEDTLGHFISECCLLDSKVQIQAGSLFATYQVWCGRMGHPPMTGTRFGRQIKERFTSESGRVIVYKGLCLNAEWSPAQRTDNRGGED